MSKQPISQESELDPNEGLLRVGLAGDGGLRWVVADVTLPLRKVRARLDLSPVATMALGRALAGVAVVSRLNFKTPARLSFDFQGSGPLERVFVESNQQGDLRGVVGRMRAEAPPGEDPLSVAAALGPGNLRVRREVGSHHYDSQVSLVSSGIGNDLAHFLLQSEQIQSAVNLGVLLNPEGVVAAGGLIVEALPGVREEVVVQLENNLQNLKSTSREIETGGLNSLESKILGGLDSELLEILPLRYRCDCERASILERLFTLSKEERQELVAEGKSVGVECGYCGEVYHFHPSEIDPN